MHTPRFLRADRRSRGAPRSWPGHGASAALPGINARTRLCPCSHRRCGPDRVLRESVWRVRHTGERGRHLRPAIRATHRGAGVTAPVPEPRHEYYESQRIRLHYAVWGDGAKPPLLLIHGGQDHCRNWDFVASRLIESYTLYAPDLRGHGDSGWAIGGMYSLPEFVYDTSVLADSLPRPLVVVGHSLGGAI